MNKLVSSAKAAKILNVTPRMLNYLTKLGRVDAIRTDGGHFRYDPETLQIKELHTPRKCKFCNKDFTTNSYRPKQVEFCSKLCNWRNHRCIRDARKRGGEHVSLTGLVKRDGNACHICRRPVDVTLSGHVEHGPTIDHVIPLVLGGPHTMNNCKLSHRRCNIIKSDMVFIVT